MPLPQEVIWSIGSDGKVAERQKHNIKTAQELKSRMESMLPQELTKLIDVFVLDVSKS
jgi:hypothetical protein